MGSTATRKEDEGETVRGRGKRNGVNAHMGMFPFNIQRPKMPAIFNLEGYKILATHKHTFETTNQNNNILKPKFNPQSKYPSSITIRSLLGQPS